MITWHLESGCVGCPQGCINCGRKIPMPVLDDLICDQCGKDTYQIWDADEGHLCEDCMDAEKLNTSDYRRITEDNFTEFIAD